MFEESSQNYKGAPQAAGVVDEGRQQAQVPTEQDQDQHDRESASVLKNTGRNRQQIALQKIKNFRVEFGPSKKDILNFTKQLAIMIRAGISLQESLESIAEQNDNEKFNIIIFYL